MPQTYSGAAQPTTLTSAIAATGTGTFTVNNATGWPSTEIFAVLIDAGTASAEKMLCSRVNQTFTIISRGHDGTALNAHAISDPVVHPVDASTLLRHERMLRGFDTRNDNLTPAQTNTDYQQRLSLGSGGGEASGTTWAPEFKTGSTLGLPAGYYGLVTVIPWGDDSGGGLHQMAYGSDGNIWHRYGVRGTSVWGAWRPLDIADTGWHLIGTAGEPAFENSWVNYSGEWETAAFRKDASGYVHLRGLVRLGTVNAVVFTLPVGFRPAAGIHTLSLSGSAPGAVRVFGANSAIPGRVVLGDTAGSAAVGSAVWFSMHIPPFLAEG